MGKNCDTLGAGFSYYQSLAPIIYSDETFGHKAAFEPKINMKSHPDCFSEVYLGLDLLPSVSELIRSRGPECVARDWLRINFNVIFVFCVRYIITCTWCPKKCYTCQSKCNIFCGTL